MGNLILLPFRTHVTAPDQPPVVVGVGPIYPPAPDTLATREDIRTFYLRYLGREPENEGVYQGRVGKNALEQEIEIATSPEAIAYLEAHGIQKPPPVVVPNVTGLTAWDQRVGLLIADDLAARLGMSAAPAGTWIVFATQAHHEDAGGDPAQSEGALYNNPLNLSDAGGTITWPGQVGRYLGSFAQFDTLEHGCEACAANYTGSYYPNVLAAFRSGDIYALAQAIQDSPWDADHYGGNLVAEVRAHAGTA